MDNEVYVVYAEDNIPAFGVYSIQAMVFVPDENPDGFALVDNHYSSDMNFAKSDIRKEHHRKELLKLFPDGFEYVDVNDGCPLPTNHNRNDVIELLQKTRGYRG